MNWYFEREGVSAGPVEESDLILMIRRREVPRDSMIWHTGLEEWRSIAELKPEWLVVPGINPTGGTQANEPAPQPRTPAVPELESLQPEAAQPVEAAPSAPPRPSQVRTVLPPAAKAPPRQPSAPPQGPRSPAEEPPPAPEKKGFLKKIFGRGKNA